MDILKRIFLTIAGLAEQIWLIPQSVIEAIKQRRRRVARAELETERLDRIRNPRSIWGSDAISQG